MPAASPDTSATPAADTAPASEFDMLAKLYDTLYGDHKRLQTDFNDLASRA